MKLYKFLAIYCLIINVLWKKKTGSLFTRYIIHLDLIIHERGDIIIMLIISNMAVMFGLAYLLSLILLKSEAANTRVEITTPINPVTVGGVLAMSCKIWNIRKEYEVRLQRVHTGRTEPIITGETYMQSSLSDRVFLARRSYPGGTVVYFITLVDVILSDRGRYLCHVYSVNEGELNKIGSDSETVEIHSFPSKLYPECENYPNKRIFSLGETMKLKCTSEKSYPLVDLKWSSSISNGYFSTQNVSDVESVAFETSVIIEQSYEKTVFVCTMKSTGFPERERSCTIGPLRITATNIEKESGIFIKQSDNDIRSNMDKNPLLSDTCNVQCSDEDPHIIVYLAAGTMGATILMITFITTTIILCCKYCKISHEVRAVQGSIPCADGSEPVYVSLQRRPEPERSSMYMSVEDPNNPGNKILMPREVIEEFYRSLSLKRKK